MTTELNEGPHKYALTLNFDDAEKHDEIRSFNVGLLTPITGADQIRSLELDIAKALNNPGTTIFQWHEADE